MQRLDFVGSAIFVPAFLVSIGLSINPALLFDWDTISLALWFTGFVVVGKSIAVLISGFVFKYSWDEMGLMASLSFGQAASTLAIAQVGFELGFFGQEVVNAAVLAIVFTALITSYGSRFFIRRVPRPVEPPAQVGEVVLVDARSHGSDLESLMRFSSAVARPDDGLVIPYSIPAPGQKGAAKAVVNHATEIASGFGLDSEGVVRVDESFSEGTLNLIEESDASLIVMSWRGPSFATDYVFGNDIDGIGERSEVPSVAARILRPWNRLIVIPGAHTTEWEKEDSDITLAIMRRIRHSRPTPLVVATDDPESFEGVLGDEEDIEFAVTKAERDAVIHNTGPDDLILLPAHVVRDLSPVASWRVSREFQDSSLAIVAGPHRLTISRGLTSRNAQSVVHTQV